MNIIGLTGVAKAGKDTFYRGLVGAYPQFRFVRLSVGDIIRRKLSDFILAETGIQVFSCTPEEKELIRPILAWYGDVKRKQSEGRFFLNQIEETCEIDSIKSADYAVITDIRFKEFKFDEPDWIHSKPGGILIHITRELSTSTDGVKWAKPANELERINDPKVKACADCVVTWSTFLPCDDFDNQVIEAVRKLEPIPLK